MITKIEHVGLMTKNIPAMAEWYNTKLGFSTVFVAEEPPFVTIIQKGSGMMIELFPWKQGFNGPVDSTERQVSHLCLESTNIDEDCSILSEKGIKFESDPFPIFNSGRAVFFRDIEGNYIHLVERPEILWD
jgi:glyoxylase I family protein